MRHMSVNKPGFTLVEMMVVIPIVTMVIVVFVTSLLSSLHQATADNDKTYLAEDSQLALKDIERDIRFSIGFDTGLNKYPDRFSDSYGPDRTTAGWTGNWSFKGTSATNRVLVLLNYATVNSPYSPNRELAYVDGRVNNPYTSGGSNSALNCDASSGGKMYENAVLPNYTIYFVRDSTLYRRVITDTTTALCNGSQYLKKTVPRPPHLHYAPGGTADDIVAENVKSFSVKYYNHETTRSYTSSTDQNPASYNEINAYASTDNSVLDAADTALVTIELGRRSGGKPVSYKTSIRVERVN